MEIAIIKGLGSGRYSCSFFDTKGLPSAWSKDRIVKNFLKVFEDTPPGMDHDIQV